MDGSQGEGLRWFETMLRNQGIDTERPMEAARMLVEHARAGAESGEPARHSAPALEPTTPTTPTTPTEPTEPWEATDPAQTWLRALLRYVERLHRYRSIKRGARDEREVSLWSPIHFVVGYVARVNTQGTVFDHHLDRVAQLFEDMDRAGIDLVRTEQYGLRFAAVACQGAPEAFTQCLTFAEAMVQGGLDPGWFLQLTLPKLWLRAPVVIVFERRCRAVHELGRSLRERKHSVGYPVAVGLAALAEYGQDVETHWDVWLGGLATVTRSLSQPYAVFEHGLSILALAQLSGDELMAAFEVVSALADHGIDPTPTMQRVLSSATDIDLASRLANRGIDPQFVLTAGWAAFSSLGWMADDGERLLALAEAVHAGGFSTRRLFEYGLRTLVELEPHYPGVAAQGLALAELMARRGLEPGVTLYFGLSRVHVVASRWPFVMGESLVLATRLTELGVDPQATLSYAVRPIAEIARGDRSEFEKLSSALTALMSRLKAMGVKTEDVLFHDLRGLVEAGGESKAFIELIRQLSDLLAVWSAETLAFDALVTKALPAALLKAIGRPWVLSMAFEVVTELARKRRAEDALVLLDSGVENALLLAGLDAAEFRRVLDAFCRGYRVLPADVLSRATIAVRTIAVRAIADSSAARHAGLPRPAPDVGESGRVDLITTIDRTFEILARSLAANTDDTDTNVADTDGTNTDGTDTNVAVTDVAGARPDVSPVQDDVSDMLPALASMADSPEAFGELIQAARAETSALEPTLRPAWRSSGLHAIAQVTPRNPAAARRLMHTLVTQTRNWGAHAAWIFWSAGPAVAPVVQDDAVAFVEVLNLLAQMAPALDCTPSAPKVVLALAAAARDGPGCAFLCGSLGAALSRLESSHDLIDGLSQIRPLVERQSEVWPRVVAPTLESHRQRAGTMLRAISRIDGRALAGEDDLDVLRILVTQLGVRALDAVQSLIVPAVRSGTIERLSQHRERLNQFVEEVGFFDDAIYRRFVEIRRETSVSEIEKSTQVAALKAEIDALTQSIRDGELSPAQESSGLLGIALVHVFPPSVSVARPSYEALYRSLADRPEDTERWDAGLLQRRPVRIARGGWQLLNDSEFDLSPWRFILQCLEGSSAVEDTPPATLGWALLCAWVEGRIARPAVKVDSVSRLLKTLRTRRPIDAATSFDVHVARDLIALRDLASDDLRDRVEECLLAARAEDGERYRRLVDAKLAPAARVGTRLVRNVFRTLEAWRDGRIDDQQGTRRVVGQLQRFAVDEDLIGRLRAACSVEEVSAVLTSVAAGGGQPSRERADATEVQRVHGDLVGQEIEAMRQTLFGSSAVPGCVVFRAGADSTVLTFEVTKRRAHAAVGFSEGVCIVFDVRLWNNPRFLQLIFWGEHGQAMGGAHLLVVDDEHGSYLALPGINPTQELLALVDVDELLDAVLDHAWRLADAWALHGVWVPVMRSIHSNRQAIHEAVARRNWLVQRTKGHAFSYSPYAYSFSDVFAVPRPVRTSESRALLKHESEPRR
ncbi:MAG: hypothetical protein IPK13_01215 [Deltaproteobacteria bacterium]|nr:hypothetical protein [Deltaproteobacteria bacterium]